MHKLQADFKIVTPMFISGANQEEVEIRPPSIKGLLRFWWRALAYSRLNNDMVELAKLEEELFGTTEQPSKIIVRINKNHFPPDKANLDLPGLRYLGYGLTEEKKQRPCINKQSFSVTFLSKELIPSCYISAIKLMGLIGSLGSRSRNGFGSLKLEKFVSSINGCPEIQDWESPKDVEQFKNRLLNLLKEVDDSYEPLPSFSCFSRHTRIDHLLEKNNPMVALDSFGRTMQLYRSYGYKDTYGKRNVNGTDSEKNFNDDHEWYLKIKDHRKIDFHPRRVVFGLPHNYKGKIVVTGTLHDRRASPLFIHVNEYSNQCYGLVSIVFRSQFLPKEEDIKVKHNDFSLPLKQKVEWQVIDDFLDGFRGSNGNKTQDRYFPEKKTWFGKRYDD